jgi:alkylation response protein AidB-like acyl-CoA dehydrogenase
LLDFTLTSQQVQLQEKARRFAMQEVLPVAWYYDEKDDTPMPVIRKAFDAGIMNIDIPAAYGGRAMGLIEQALVTEEIAAACAGLATSIFDSSLGMEPILLSSNEAAKMKYLPKIVKEFKLMDWEGVTIGRKIPKMGQRCSNTVGINFKNVRVPRENILAPPGKGFVLAMQTFARTRPIIGSFMVMKHLKSVPTVFSLKRRSRR